MSGTKKVFVLDHDNFRWKGVSPVVVEAIHDHGDLTCTVSDDKEYLRPSRLADFDVVVIGSGFMSRRTGADGAVDWIEDFSSTQSDALLAFVHDGGGLAGFHATAWSLPPKYSELLGGHANVHPKMATTPYHVAIDSQPHPITSGVSSFAVLDEVYMIAWSPHIRILARTELDGPQWAGRGLPVAWTHNYGKGRVFYTTLGHHAASFDHAEARRLVANGVAWAAGLHQ